MTMRDLPLVAPDGCSLSADGLATQRDRALAIRSAVERVERSADELTITFDASVEADRVTALIETERRCCSFLEIDYEPNARLLRIAADDAAGREVVAQFAALFAPSEVR